MLWLFIDPIVHRPYHRLYLFVRIDHQYQQSDPIRRWPCHEWTIYCLDLECEWICKYQSSDPI